jgi:hypothetical protein
MEQAKAVAASWARSFMAAALALYMAGVTDPKTLATAGVAAGLIQTTKVLATWGSSQKLTAAGLVWALALILTACGYDGWVRYECQEYESWSKPECQKPQCVPTGTCTDDILGFTSTPSGAP